MLAATLRDVFNTANPAPLPSGDPRYVDCTAVRGNEDVVRQLFQRITWSDLPATTQLFTGHRGCGKSTELLRLKTQLEAADFAVIVSLGCREEGAQRLQQSRRSLRPPGELQRVEIVRTMSLPHGGALP